MDAGRKLFLQELAKKCLKISVIGKGNPKEGRTRAPFVSMSLPELESLVDIGLNPPPTHNAWWKASLTNQERIDIIIKWLEDNK